MSKKNKEIITLNCDKDITGTVNGLGNINILGSNSFNNFDISSIIKSKNVIQISFGLEHTGLLFADGTVNITGNNDYGQCDPYDIDVGIGAKCLDSVIDPGVIGFSEGVERIGAQIGGGGDTGMRKFLDAGKHHRAGHAQTGNAKPQITCRHVLPRFSPY